MLLITLVMINSLFIFSLIWMIVFLALATIVLVIPAPLLVNNYLFLIIASNKAVESLLIHATSADIDSVVDIIRTVVYATNALCWLYTSEITVLMLMYNFFIHPGT